MTTTWFLLSVALWLLAWGVLTAWVAGLLHQERFGWWIIGTVLGPLSIPALVSVARSRRRGSEEPTGPSTVRPLPARGQAG